MPSPWYSGKLDNEVTLKAGTAAAFGEITVDQCAPDDMGLVVGNLKMRLTSSGPKKMDIYLLRVKADDWTAWQSPCFPGGTDDFYWWPVWLGELTKGETYRWYVRLESGLSGSMSVRYAKGVIIPKVGAAALGVLGMDEVSKFSTTGAAEAWSG